ncbi:MAG: hypothetical protein JO269_03505 [Burkholderiaceae bacterium]|nr:hypothetical protein [Burkholderiaceae bacterium]
MKNYLVNLSLCAISGIAIAEPSVPAVSTLACFNQQIRIESFCHPSKYDESTAECDSQILYLPKGKFELKDKDDKAMTATDWSCSKRQDHLYIYSGNGGNCVGCEKQETLDANGHRTSRYVGVPPEMMRIELMKQK